MIDYPYQYLPPLDPETRAELKAKIAEYGVLVPIEKDEHGNILDGHHRLELCAELGITEYPIATRFGMTEDEKIRYTIAINENRRKPSEDNRKFAALKLRGENKSLRVIAEMVGVSHEAIRLWVSGVKLLDTCEDNNEAEPERVTGADGKSYAAHKPKTMFALTEQQTDAGLKCVGITGLPDNAPSSVTAHEVIHEANKTLYATSNNRLDSMMTSNSFEWYTPAEIANRVRRVLGRIDLDPCTSEAANTVIQAAEIYTLETDGLKQNWRAETLFMNPPYGDTIGQWVEKLHAEHKAGNVAQALALVPARTDTQWFRILAEYPRVFLYGRLKFGGPNNVDNSATFPSAVIALGCDLDAVCAAFGDLGDIYERVEVAK